MLSNQSKYAIRAIIYLALYADEKNKTSSKTVAKLIEVPAPFLAKIFQTLSKSKLIRSAKGPNGGFYMTKKELSRNLMEVIECIDGLDSFNTCFIGLPVCSDENPCGIHHIVSPYRKLLIKELTERNIKEFAEDTKKGKTFIFLK